MKSSVQTGQKTRPACALPPVPGIREKLLTLKEQQKENRQICGNCCNKEYGGCVFADVMDSPPASWGICARNLSLTRAL